VTPEGSRVYDISLAGVAKRLHGRCAPCWINSALLAVGASPVVQLSFSFVCYIVRQKRVNCVCRKPRGKIRVGLSGFRTSTLLNSRRTW
jgi:hypothetical protein